MDASQREGTRTCVVLRPRNDALSPTLRSALFGRGFDLIECDSPYLALAHLVALHRQTAPRGPGSSRPVVVLLLALPADASPLLTTLDRYLPAVPCWVYDQSTSPALRALDPGEAASSRASRDPTPRTPRPSEPAADDPPDAPDVVGRVPHIHVRYPRDRTPASAPGYASMGSPPLRLIGPAASADDPMDPARKDPPQSLLTDEELAMLLSDEPPRSSGGLG